MSDDVRRGERVASRLRLPLHATAWIVGFLWLGSGVGCQLILPLDPVEKNSALGAQNNAGGKVGGAGDDGASGAGDDGASGAGDNSALQGGTGTDDCVPYCYQGSCEPDGCGGYCTCPAGTACDPDLRTCEDATCYEGVRTPCPAAAQPSFVDWLDDETMRHRYEALINDDPVCYTQFAVHLHCDACGLDLDGSLPICWARCVCDDEIDEIDYRDSHDWP